MPNIRLRVMLSSLSNSFLITLNDIFDDSFRSTSWACIVGVDYKTIININQKNSTLVIICDTHDLYTIERFLGCGTGLVAQPRNSSQEILRHVLKYNLRLRLWSVFQPKVSSTLCDIVENRGIHG